MTKLKIIISMGIYEALTCVAKLWKGQRYKKWKETTRLLAPVMRHVVRVAAMALNFLPEFPPLPLHVALPVLPMTPYASSPYQRISPITLQSVAFTIKQEKISTPLLSTTLAMRPSMQMPVLTSFVHPVSELHEIIGGSATTPMLLHQLLAHAHVAADVSRTARTNKPSKSIGASPMANNYDKSVYSHTLDLSVVDGE
jgi:hypothetical protein